MADPNLRRNNLAAKLAAMTVERGCTPAEAATATRLLAAMQNKTAMPDEQGLDFYRMMLWYAQVRGYKTGWAAHMFKGEFGHWPRFNNPEPLKPDDPTLDLIDAWRRQAAKEMRAKEQGL